MTTKLKKVHAFRMLPDVGSHFEPNVDFDPDSPEDDDNIREIEYEAGDVVKSKRELDKLFANKFTRQVKGDESELNDPFRDVPVRSAEAANKRETGRFLGEDELEGKPELQKLAKGVKSKDPFADDEESDESEEEDEESAAESVEEEAPKKKKRKAK